MNKIQLDSNFSISEQVTLAEIESLASDGVKVLICNRPDGEEPNQISCDDVKAKAESHGIKFVHIPVPGRIIPEEALMAFTETLDNCEDKIHAYCRTGTRSSIFWGLSEARNNSAEQVLSNAESLGINLSPVADQLEEVCRKQQ